MAHVELDIIPGRPNPRWDLRKPDSFDLVDQLKDPRIFIRPRAAPKMARLQRKTSSTPERAAEAYAIILNDISDELDETLTQEISTPPDE